MKNETINVEEIQANPYEGVNMGRNIKYVRESRNIYQKELAEAINVSPKTISRIEEREFIKDEELLNKIAKYLDCDVNFLKYNKMEEVVKNYNIHTPTNSPVTNSAENSHDEIIQPQNNTNEDQENNYIINNNCPIEEIKDLFLNILKDKDQLTNRLMDELKELKEDIQTIKKEK